MPRSFDIQPRKIHQHNHVNKKDIEEIDNIDSNDDNHKTWSWIILVIGIIIIVSIIKTEYSPKNTYQPIGGSVTNEIASQAVNNSNLPFETTSGDVKGISNQNNNNNTQKQPEENTNSQIRIKILNGSTKSANLDSLKNKLENNSFKITEAGKAKNTYKKTTIYYHEGKSNEADKINETINSQASTSESNNLAGDDYDIVIVIGKNYAD